jgi:hypothetical protein
MTYLSEPAMDSIITDGVAFMRSITNAYGAEEGMELWNTIADTLGPDVKGKIFFAMLTNSHDDKVTLSGAVQGSPKITCIKIIRQYTAMSLIDAKEAYENAADYGTKVILKVEPKFRRSLIDELRLNGMIVS